MLAHACAGKKTSLKAALLDQRVVAGLGNIYVCEALYRAHLSPKRQASTIADRHGKPNARAVALVDAIKAVLHDAIKAGGSSLRDHRQADGSLGYFQHSFKVYDREGDKCPTAKAPSSASFKPAARHFIARAARNNSWSWQRHRLRRFLTAAHPVLDFLHSHV